MQAPQLSHSLPSKPVSPVFSAYAERRLAGQAVRPMGASPSLDPDARSRHHSPGRQAAQPVSKLAAQGAPSTGIPGTVPIRGTPTGTTLDRRRARRGGSHSFTSTLPGGWLFAAAFGLEPGRRTIRCCPDRTRAAVRDGRRGSPCLPPLGSGGRGRSGRGLRHGCAGRPHYPQGVFAYVGGARARARCSR
jgi:hypothetical protein